MRGKFLSFLFLWIFFLLFNIFFQDIYDVSNINYNLSDDFSNIFFCPRDACLNETINFIESSSNSLNCALYDLSHPEVIASLNNVSERGVLVKVFVDDKNLKKLSNYNISFNVFDDSMRKSRYNNLMHEKFCVSDDSLVYFGSVNPTINGLEFNNNVVVILNDSNLAREFNSEFRNFENNLFGVKKFSSINASYDLQDSGSMSVFFCPVDDCLGNVYNVLNSANKSIFFSSFVLTEDLIEDLFINKSKSGLNISGVIERRTSKSKGSIPEVLSKYINLSYDSNKKTMHHKFFIVDNQIVIFGSANPTKGGFMYNDEFVIIINNSRISNLFLEEFNILRNSSISA